jgi:hypothetical protein
MKKALLKKQLFLCILFFATLNIQAQQKIKDGTGTPATSLPAAGSILELQSTQAGLRMPQIVLTNTTTWAPLVGSGTAPTSPGMSVYNSNAGITSTNVNYPANGVGEYSWDGIGWINKNSSVTQSSLVLFSVKITTTQTMPSNAWTQISFDTKDYDKNNNYNLAANTFTVPANAAGYYQVNLGFATFVQASTQGAYVGLYVNGGFRRYITIANTGAGSGIAGGGTIALPLAAGDVVDFRYFGNTAGQQVYVLQIDMYQMSR